MPTKYGHFLPPSGPLFGPLFRTPFAVYPLTPPIYTISRQFYESPIRQCLDSLSDPLFSPLKSVLCGNDYSGLGKRMRKKRYNYDYNFVFLELISPHLSYKSRFSKQ